MEVNTVVDDFDEEYNKSVQQISGSAAVDSCSNPRRSPKKRKSVSIFTKQTTKMSASSFDDDYSKTLSTLK